MACYRKGGCGPYEMLSCGECPASNPNYLSKKRTTSSASKEKPTGQKDFLGNDILVGDTCVFLQNSRTGSSTTRKVFFKDKVTGFSPCKVRFECKLVFGTDIIDLDAYERSKR